MQSRWERDISLEIVESFISADIPLDKLKNDRLRSTLEKLGKMKLPSISSLRRDVDSVYNSVMDRIRKEIGQNDIYLVIDETTDRLDRMQVNMIVGVLNGSQSRPMLAYVDFVDAADSVVMLKLFINCCKRLFPQEEDTPFARVRLILSDQAPYMVKTVKNIKALIPDSFHVTCLAHCFHRVSESIRAKYPTTDRFIGSFNEILRGSRKRQKDFIRINGLKIPPKPVITRWGTWLNTAAYYAANLSKVKIYLDSFSKDKLPKCIEVCKTIISEKQVSDEILSISDYTWLPNMIEKLETQNLKLEATIAILSETKARIDSLDLEEPKKKLESSLRKNPDLKRISSLDKLEDRILFKFAPLTSCDVQRSFSKTKSILAANRSNFTEENLVKNYIINYNSFLL